MDLGNFGSAVDNIFDQRTSITIDIFFLMVVDWAGLQDCDDRASSSIMRRQLETANLDETHHMYDEPYYNQAQAAGQYSDAASSAADSVGTANLNDLKGMYVHRADSKARSLVTDQDRSVCFFLPSHRL